MCRKVLQSLSLLLVPESPPTVLYSLLYYFGSNQSLPSSRNTKREKKGGGVGEITSWKTQDQCYLLELGHPVTWKVQSLVRVSLAGPPLPCKSYRAPFLFGEGHHILISTFLDSLSLSPSLSRPFSLAFRLTKQAGANSLQKKKNQAPFAFVSRAPGSKLSSFLILLTLALAFLWKVLEEIALVSAVIVAPLHFLSFLEASSLGNLNFSCLRLEIRQVQNFSSTLSTHLHPIRKSPKILRFLVDSFTVPFKEHAPSPYSASELRPH